MEDDTFSVSQVADIIGISPQAVRSWTTTYSDHLSEEATPPEDTERRYLPEDIAIFTTVKVLRDQREPHKRIIPRVADGERLEPTPPDTDAEPLKSTQEPRKSDPGSDMMSPRDLQNMRRIAKLEGELDTIRLERDWLREQYTNAEKRAAAAEARLEAIKAPEPEAGQVGDDHPQAADESPRPWYRSLQFWK